MTGRSRLLRGTLVAAALLVIGAAPQSLSAQAVESAEDIAERVRGLDRVTRSALDASRFEEALRAAEEAHRLTKDPKYLYNQGYIAERAFVALEREADLVRAVEALRAYLQAAPDGKRRVDARGKLKRLEPLMPKPPDVDPNVPPTPSAPPPSPAPARTGVMVSSATPGVLIELDGKTRAKGFLVADVEAGPHVIRLSAEGFIPVERTVPVQVGALLGLDIALEPMPALLTVDGPAGADLSIDGEPKGELPLAKPLALPPGDHLITVRMTGAHSLVKWQSLSRGAAVTVDADLETTSQRMAAWATFAVSGTAAVVGATLTGLAFERQARAAEILRPVTEETGSIGTSDVTAFESAVAERDLYRTLAGVSWGVAGAGLTAGIFLFVFDDEAVTSPPPPPGPRPAEPRPEEGGVELSVAPVILPDSAFVSLAGRF